MNHNDADYFIVGFRGLAVVTYALYLVFDRLLCRMGFPSFPCDAAVKLIAFVTFNLATTANCSESA